MTISVDLEFKELKEKLKQFEGEMPKNIVKKMMAAVFSKMRIDARKAVPRKTGRLRDYINYWKFNDWAGGLTTWNKKKGEGVKKSGFYGSFHEYGAPDIHAKEDGTKTIRYIVKKTGTPVIYENKYLTFKINGVWKKVEATRGVPKKPFMQPSFDKYFAGNAELGIKIMNEKLQKEMDRIINKGDTKT